MLRWGGDNLFPGDRYKWGACASRVINPDHKTAVYNFLFDVQRPRIFCDSGRRRYTAELGFHF